MSEDTNRTDEDARSNDRTNGFSFTRRGMLAAGAAGLGLAGSTEAAGAQQGGGNNNAPFAIEDHDHGGDYLGEQEPVDRLDVRTIGGSRREGDTVYYDPDDPGPYADGQEALADVPRGGTFHIGHGVWDVATEGRLEVDKEIRIRGAGWTKEPFTFGDDIEVHGTIIDNTGDDVVDEPAVEFKPADPDNPRLHNTELRDVMVLHEGRTSPAVRMETLRSLISECWIGCSGVAPIGVKYEDHGFFARMERSRVTGFTEYGVQVTGTGYAHEFYSNNVASGQDGVTALETQRHRTIIMGGEYAAPHSEGGTAIRFYNPGPNPLSGGLVLEPGVEATELAVEIDGEAPFQGVQCYHQMMLLGHGGENVGVRFGNARNAKIVNPITHGSPGEIAQWSSEAVNCGLITDSDTMKNCSYTDHGATKPWVTINGSATNEDLTQLPTGVPTTVDYGIDENSPVFHDGTSWYNMPSASFSPGGDEGNDGPETVHYDVANGTITPDGDLETDGLSTWNLHDDGRLVDIVDGDGTDAIGGDVWLGWDADNLYFQAAIDDPVHHQPYGPGQLVRGDYIALAMAPGADGWEQFLQYIIALNDNGTQVVGVIQPEREDYRSRDVDAQVVRDDVNEVTRYEVAIPWTELDPLGGFDPASDEYLGVDWAVMDADGEREDNIDRFVRWQATGGSAITSGKEPDLLKAAQLLD